MPFSRPGAIDLSALKRPAPAAAGAPSAGAPAGGASYSVEVDEKNFEQLVYPTVVMMAAILALVGLGLFQYLSRRSQREAKAGADDADATDDTPGRRVGLT